MSSLWLVKKTAVAASEGDCGGGLNQFFFLVGFVGCAQLQERLGCCGLLEIFGEVIVGGSCWRSFWRWRIVG